MTALHVSTGSAQKNFVPPSRFGPVGMGVVLGIHVLLAYALVSGLARKAVQAVQKPLMASIVPEVASPPPPPPPPKPQRLVKHVKAAQAPPPTYVPAPDAPPPAAAAPAPAIAAVQSIVPVPAPAAPAPPAPAAPGPVPVTGGHVEVGVACPGYRQTLQTGLAGWFERVGIAGTVKVQFKVRGDSVLDVATISGPREYARAVQTAVRRFNCHADGGEEAIVAFDISFRSE